MLGMLVLICSIPPNYLLGEKHLCHIDQLTTNGALCYYLHRNYISQCLAKKCKKKQSSIAAQEFDHFYMYYWG